MWETSFLLQTNKQNLCKIVIARLPFSSATPTLTGKAVGDAIFIRVVGDERDNPTTYRFRCEHITKALQKCLFADSLPCCTSRHSPMPPVCCDNRRGQERHGQEQ